MMKSVLRTICLILLAAIPSFAQGYHVQLVAEQNLGGYLRPISFAGATICTSAGTGIPCTPTTTIYSDAALTQTTANPITADINGNYGFYISGGPSLVITVTGTGVTGYSFAYTVPLSNISPLNTQPGPAQIGPFWFPGTGRTPADTCTAPVVAPTVAVDLTITGSLDTTTYYYKVTYINRNGETTASPTKTFAASAGITNAIGVQSADINWATGCRGFRTYVSSDNVNFYLQTPFANAFQTTGHLNPGDAIFKTFTFSGTLAPTTNTATIDPLQVALNATWAIDPSTKTTATVSGVLQLNQRAVLTTPLVLGVAFEKIQGPAKNRQQDEFNGGHAGQIRCNWADVNDPCVVVQSGTSATIGVSGDGFEIYSAGHCLGLIGNGAGWVSGIGSATFRNMSLRNISSSGTYSLVVAQAFITNLSFDNVYMAPDKAVLLAQYASGLSWKFANSRWDLNKGAILSVTGPVDRDRSINYAGFSNVVNNVTVEQTYTENGSGVIFDAVNMNLHLKQFSSADLVGSGVPYWKVGNDVNSAGAGADTLEDSSIGAGSATVAVQLASTTGAVYPGLVLISSSIPHGTLGSVDRNNLIMPIYAFYSDLCVDSVACNSGNTIINTPAGYGSGQQFGVGIQGQKDISSQTEFMSSLGKHLTISSAHDWTKRRNIYIDQSNTRLGISQAANDSEVDCSAADLCIDAAQTTLRNFQNTKWVSGNQYALTGAGVRSALSDCTALAGCGMVVVTKAITFDATAITVGPTASPFTHPIVLWLATSGSIGTCANDPCLIQGAHSWIMGLGPRRATAITGKAGGTIIQVTSPVEDWRITSMDFEGGAIAIKARGTSIGTDTPGGYIADNFFGLTSPQTGNAIEMQSIADTTIERNYINAPGGACLRVGIYGNTEPNYGTWEQSKIERNYCVNAGTKGFWFEPDHYTTAQVANGFKFDTNYISNPTNDGFWFKGGLNTADIRNTQFSNLVFTTNTYDAMHLEQIAGGVAHVNTTVSGVLVPGTNPRYSLFWDNLALANGASNVIERIDVPNGGTAAFCLRGQIRLMDVLSGSTFGAGNCNLYAGSPSIGNTLNNPAITGTPTGTGIPTVTAKNGSASNYTGTNTSYANVDTTNLCQAVTIPSGWKLSVVTVGSAFTSTGVATVSMSLSDIGTTCGAGGTTPLREIQYDAAGGANIPVPFAVIAVINGDGAAHAISLQIKTSNASEAWNLVSSSATLAPSIVLTLTPSN